MVETPPWDTSLTPLEDLGPLLEAVKLGLKLSRLRLTALVCPEGHTLAGVYRGASGALWALLPSNRVDSRRSLSSMGLCAVRLSSRDGDALDALVGGCPLWCRCPGRGVNWHLFHTEPLVSAANAGVPRFVASDEWNLFGLTGEERRARWEAPYQAARRMVPHFAISGHS